MFVLYKENGILFFSIEALLGKSYPRLRKTHIDYAEIHIVFNPSVEHSSSESFPEDKTMCCICALSSAARPELMHHRV